MEKTIALLKEKIKYCKDQVKTDPHKYTYTLEALKQVLALLKKESAVKK